MSEFSIFFGLFSSYLLITVPPTHNYLENPCGGSLCVCVCAVSVCLPPSGNPGNPQPLHLSYHQHVQCVRFCQMPRQREEHGGMQALAFHTKQEARRESLWGHQHRPSEWIPNEVELRYSDTELRYISIMRDAAHPSLLICKRPYRPLIP